MTGQPGRLQFMGLQGVGHNLVTEQQQHLHIYAHALCFHSHIHVHATHPCCPLSIYPLECSSFIHIPSCLPTCLVIYQHTQLSIHTLDCKSIHQFA